MIDEEENNFADEIKVQRLGKYEIEGTRPVKVMLKSLLVMKEVVLRMFKLIRLDNFRRLLECRRLDKEERNNLKVLKEEITPRNKERSAEDRVFW